jgi:hypothetical protein
MKLMKVIYNLENMMNKEFQHFVEFQLIEVRMMKMQMIQFVSILNLIQMKLMKVMQMTCGTTEEEYELIEESRLDVHPRSTRGIQLTDAQCHCTQSFAGHKVGPSDSYEPEALIGTSLPNFSNESNLLNPSNKD